MYNQFTELQQKPLHMKKVQLNPLDIPRAGKKKKPKVHSKNPYKIKKVRLLGQEAMKQKHLDGFLLLKLLRFEHPKDIMKANISYKRIVSVQSEHLKFFQNLIDLNCSQNRINLQWLTVLPALQILNISHNNIVSLPLQIKNFKNLRSLNISFNHIEYNYIPHLSMIPKLQQLNIGYNQLRQLPEDMSPFEQLTKLNLSGNQFSSSYKPSAFWQTLASIEGLVYLDVGRNKIRGIHTQKLVNGNFANLQILDFSYNSVENQHNLICARNFKNLKKIIATGNPFAIEGNYKGLEMQIYARTGGQLIVENVGVYYLKNAQKQRIPIKFDRIVKIQPDNFQKSKNILFGVDIMRDPSISQSQEQQQVEVEQQIDPQEQQEEQEHQPMFITEQPAFPKSKKVVNEFQPAEKVVLSPNESKQGSISNVSVQNCEIQMREESIRSDVSSASVGMEEFRRVAAEMIGNSRQYKHAFDINTAYKALKGALDRSKNI